MRSRNSPRKVFLPFVFALAATAMPLLGGCYDSVEPDSTDNGKIRLLVSRFADDWINVAKTEAIFTSGAAPPDEQRKRYGDLAFGYVEDSLTHIGENDVSFQVDFVKFGTGEPVSTETWTAVKEGEDWKLKTAPLPPAP